MAQPCADGAAAATDGATCNMALRLGALHRLPGCGSFFDRAFPGASYEDVEMCVRNLGAGVRIAVAPRAAVAHDFSPAAGGDPEEQLARRFERYGASEHILFETHSAWTYVELYAQTRAQSLDQLRAEAARGGVCCV